MIRAGAPRGSAAAKARTTLCLAALVTTPVVTMAAPVVADADVQVTFLSPTSCTVALAVSVDSDTVEHRIEIADGAEVALLRIVGARQVGETKDVGRTRALVLEPDADRYSLDYEVTQPANRAGQCPLWIPTVPTAGRERVVQITVRLPPGATAGGTMPSFVWTGEEGTALIGHLPAFVRVPYGLPGEPRPWNIARLMDAVAVVTLLAATALWTRRRGLTS